MESIEEMRDQIQRLEAQLAIAQQHQRHAYRPAYRGSYRSPPYPHSYRPRPSRNMRLVVQNGSSSASGAGTTPSANQYVSSGNRLVRVGSGSEASIRPPPPPLRPLVRPVRRGRNMTLRTPTQPPAAPPAETPAEAPAGAEAQAPNANGANVVEVEGGTGISTERANTRRISMAAQPISTGEPSAPAVNNENLQASRSAVAGPSTARSDNFVRTATGNLVRVEALVEHRTRRERELERRRPLCSQFMYGRCRYTASQCRHSHVPTPETTPVCFHHQADRCTHDPCMFLHKKENANAPICRPFVYEGYCAKGINCMHRHVWECPDWVEKNKCTRTKCRLRHPPKHSDSKDPAGADSIKGKGKETDTGTNNGKSGDASDDDDILKLYDGDDPNEQEAENGQA